MTDEYDMGPMLTVTELARLLHVHSNTIRRWADSGAIKTYCIGTRKDRRFKREDVEQYLTKVTRNTGIAVG